MDFGQLSELRTKIIELRSAHIDTLKRYLNNSQNGFFHQNHEKDKTSLASSATCFNSLVFANDIDTFIKSTKGLFKPSDLVSQLYNKKTSADLQLNNPFSLSFVCELVQQVKSFDKDYGKSIDLELRKKIDRKIGGNLRYLYYLISNEQDYSAPNSKRKFSSIKVPKGAIGISPYPASPYLTQLVFRVLTAANFQPRASSEAESKARFQDLKISVSDWASKEIKNQISRISNEDRHADPLALGYAIILLASAKDIATQTPADRESFGNALDVFFNSQKSDGSWPTSNVLFHYPSVGNAYCFEFELLAQLLSTKSLWGELLRHTDKLAASVDYLFRQAYDLDPTKPGRELAWASGHHPQLEGPESWSTASVYQFLAALDRMVAEGVRRHIFQEFRTAYKSPVDFKSNEAGEDPATGLKRRWDEETQNQLDSTLDQKENVVRSSLAETMYKRFAEPLGVCIIEVKKGKSLPKKCPMSAVLYGPPGTSKTTWAEMLAKFLGWPLLSIDPSYIVAEGMDRVYALTNRLFSMLSIAEEIVVLLDEFDEMGRDRTRSDNVLSRFFTTAMLPKLIEINKNRRIVFLLATNYLSEFDSAFTRDGRFDMKIQVMQPNLKGKMGRANRCFALSEEIKSLEGALKASDDKDLMRKFDEAKNQFEGIPDSQKLAQFWALCCEGLGGDPAASEVETVTGYLAGKKAKDSDGSGEELTWAQVIDDLTFGEFRSWIGSSELTNESALERSISKWVSKTTLRKSNMHETRAQALVDATLFYGDISKRPVLEGSDIYNDIKEYVTNKSPNILGRLSAKNWDERCKQEASELRIPAPYP